MPKTEPPKWSLRPAMPADAAFAFRVWKEAMQDYIALSWGWDEEWQCQHQKEEFATRAYRIIETAGQPIGTLVTEVRADCLYVSGLYILPEHQGRGSGSWVLAQLTLEARQQSLPIRLLVLRVNPRALRLYEQEGFTTIDDSNALFRIMEKRL